MKKITILTLALFSILSLSAQEQKLSLYGIAQNWRDTEYVLCAPGGNTHDVSVCMDCFAHTFVDNPMLQALGSYFTGDSDSYKSQVAEFKLDMKNGYVKILDRVTDIIIVGGFNVYPQEVEKVLSEHPAVQTAIVVGVPHPTNGEIQEAYIQRRDGAELTERELIKFTKERLAHYKVPRRIEFVDEFPLSGTGKILRRVLREQAGKKGL